MPQNPQPSPQTGTKPLKYETACFDRQAANTFREAVEGLGIELTPKAMVLAFGGRFTRWQLIDWARGKARPNRGVMDYLEHWHRQRSARHEALATACAGYEVGRHSPNIKAWNARRAAEKAGGAS